MYHHNSIQQKPAQHRIRLENQQKHLLQESAELQQFLLKGIQPSQLRIKTAMDALSRLRELSVLHAQLSLEIHSLDQQISCGTTAPTQAEWASA